MAGKAMTQTSSQSSPPESNGSGTEPFSAKGSGARARIGQPLFGEREGAGPQLRQLGLVQRRLLEQLGQRLAFRAR